jgi:hypothetical protein
LFIGQRSIVFEIKFWRVELSETHDGF